MDSGLISIGQFSTRCRLSPKALRLYHRLGLVVPVRVDRDTGYRWYSPVQVDRARLVGLLRRLDMPLAMIAELVDRPAAEAVAGVRAHVAALDQVVRERTDLADYACLLMGDRQGRDDMTPTYEVQVRTVPSRAVLSGTRRAHAAALGATLGELLGRLRAAGPGLPGIAGCPYITYYADVSDDSDGPVELVRPVAELAAAEQCAQRLTGVQARVEAEHDEAYVRLTMAETRSTAGLQALDVLHDFAATASRDITSPPRQIMIADWRTAGPDEPACDLAIALRPLG